MPPPSISHLPPPGPKSREREVPGVQGQAEAEPALLLPGAWGQRQAQGAGTHRGTSSTSSSRRTRGANFSLRVEAERSEGAKYLQEVLRMDRGSGFPLRSFSYCCFSHHNCASSGPCLSAFPLPPVPLHSTGHTASDFASETHILYSSQPLVGRRVRRRNDSPWQDVRSLDGGREPGLTFSPLAPAGPGGPMGPVRPWGEKGQR